MATELREVPIAHCYPADELNTRQNGLGDISALAASIEAIGVQEPLLGKQNIADRVEIFAGFRRLKASQEIGLETVPVMVYADIDRQTMFVFNLTENVQRLDLNPVDEALAYKRMQEEYSLGVAEICAKMGVKKVRVQQRLRLLKLADIVRDAVHGDRLSIAAALEIDRLPKDKQEKFISIAEELGGERLKKLVDKELEKLQTKMEGTEKEPKEETDPADVDAIVKGMKKSGAVICAGLGYDKEQTARLKEVNFRILEPDDLKVVGKLFDDCADVVEDDVDFNAKAAQELTRFAEGGVDDKYLNTDSPVVSQGIQKMLRERAVELAKEHAEGTGRRPKVTFAIAQKTIDEFYTDGEPVE